MKNDRYTHPVSQLLTLGHIEGDNSWPDYPATLGLTHEHIPDLIRMATDEALNDADSESDEVWAPIHAWRALAQLHATEAIEPLLSLFHRIDEYGDDWIADELPAAYGVLGPDAIPALRDFMADPANGIWARTGAAGSLSNIATQHPEARDEVIAILTDQLAHFADQDRVFNASLVMELAGTLHAQEAAPVIERAYKADKVDLMAMGDWEDVQIQLGLLEARQTTKPNYFELESPEAFAVSQRLTEKLERVLAAHTPDEEPGRNDPCWCGSGKKYKHCHLREDKRARRASTNADGSSQPPSKGRRQR